MCTLAATRPHDRTFHSRLLQLEVEFNERVRYLPTPQPHVVGSANESSVHTLDDVGSSSSRYAVFEEQFEEIIAHDNLFAHLLRRVKTEYDRQIRELTRAVYSRYGMWTLSLRCGFYTMEGLSALLPQLEEWSLEVWPA